MQGSTPGPAIVLADLVRQCAWCLRVLDAEGHYSISAPVLLRNATHGCCGDCTPKFLGNLAEAYYAYRRQAAA